jgi:hypothetical protein
MKPLIDATQRQPIKLKFRRSGDSFITAAGEQQPQQQGNDDDHQSVVKRQKVYFF